MDGRRASCRVPRKKATMEVHSAAPQELPLTNKDKCRQFRKKATMEVHSAPPQKLQLANKDKCRRFRKKATMKVHSAPPQKLPLTNKEKCRRFREKLKLDPERLEAYKAETAERSRQRRQNMSEEQKAAVREQARKRQQAFRTRRMVVTRKQAADSCQVTHSQDVHSLDTGPHSNLNLLASSASCEALSLGSSRRTSASAHRDGSQPPGPSMATSSVAKSRAAGGPVSSDITRAVAGSSELNAVSGSGVLPTEKTPGQSVLPSSAPILPSTALPHMAVPHSSCTPCGSSGAAVSGGSAAVVDTVPYTVVSNALPAVVNTVLSAGLSSVSSVVKSAVPSGVVSAVPLSSTPSSQMAVAAIQGTGHSPVRSQTVTASSGDKAASVKQYKIVYRPPLSSASAPKPLSSPSSLGLGTGLAFRPPSTTSLSALPTAYTLCAAPGKGGAPPRHILVPISRAASFHAPTAASLISPRVPIRPPRSSVSQTSGSLGTPSPATVIVMPPLASAVTSSSAALVSNADSIGSSTTLMPVLPALAPASTVPVISHSVSVTGPVVGLSVSAGGPVVGHPVSAGGPAVGLSVSAGGPAVGHSVSAGGPVVGHSVSAGGPAVGLNVSTSGPVVGQHSVSYTLSQLAHTAKADMTAQTQNNMARVGVIGQVKPHMTTAGHAEVNSGRMDVTGPLHIVSMGTSTPHVNSMTTGLMVAPSPQHTVLSTPLLPIMAPTSEHMEELTPQATPTPEHTDRPTSRAASTAEAAVSVGSLMEGEAVSWNRRCTLKLIQLYKEHQVYLTDHHYKKKSVWELIATKLRQSIPDSPPFRWNHVENKWKNMTKKFRDCVDLSRRGVMISKCNFFDEIAEIYKYSPDEDQKKAAEGLRALKSAAHRQSSLLAPFHHKDGSSQGQGAGSQGQGAGSVPDSAGISMKVERGSGQDESCGSGGPSLQTDGVLVKKKKYAHLDEQSSSTSSPMPTLLSPPLLPHPPAPELNEGGDGGGKEVGVDIVALLHQLREDRVRQDSARMERLEQMHHEKMDMFAKFLDILQQSKHS